MLHGQWFLTLVVTTRRNSSSRVVCSYTQCLPFRSGQATGSTSLQIVMQVPPALFVLTFFWHSFFVLLSSQDELQVSGL